MSGEKEVPCDVFGCSWQWTRASPTQLPQTGPGWWVAVTKHGPQRWWDRGLGGSILLCHFLVVHVTLGLIFLIYQMGLRITLIGLRWETGDTFVEPSLGAQHTHTLHTAVIMTSSTTPIRGPAHFSMGQLCRQRIYRVLDFCTLWMHVPYIWGSSLLLFFLLQLKNLWGQQETQSTGKKVRYQGLCLNLLQSKQHKHSVSSS